MENARILLVDDEQDIVETVKYSLELRGYTVEAAYDGPSALAKARRSRFDAMILDVMLPGKNGYEVSRLLKEDMEKKRIEPFGIILFTARRLTSEFREDFVSTWSKADACIYKPFDMEDLLDKIAAVMDGAASTRAES